MGDDILHKLPVEAQYKMKELDLKSKILNESCLISMTDRRGYITYANDLFCELSGFTREELIGQKSSAKDLRDKMDEVSIISHNLASVANQLLEEVSKFKLKT